MIVYLHGLASSGASAKATWLRERLADVLVLSPTYPAWLAQEALKSLRDYFARQRRKHGRERKLLLVGSSLGGFWARYLAPELGAGMALINPVLHPETDLVPALGLNRIDATGEEFIFNEQHMRALARYAVAKCDPGVPTLVLHDEADLLLDYRAAQSFYQDCGRVIVYPGGSHGFDHLPEALPEIRRLYDSL